MKTTIPKLRKMIRKVLIEHVGDEHHERSKEPGEGYVEDMAHAYVAEVDYEGYLAFGAEYGYSEDQLDKWFGDEEDALFRKDRDAYDGDPIRRGKADIDVLKQDIRNKTVDLQRNPYALD